MTLSADWSGEYNGLIFGAGTSYKLLRDGTSLGGLPITRTADQPRASAPGVVAAVDRLGGRTIVLAISAFGGSATAVGSLAQTWRNAFKPQTSDQPLDLRLPGLPETVIRFFGRPRELNDDISWWSSGSQRWAQQFAATDPLMYGAAVTASNASALTVNNSGSAATSRITLTVQANGGTPQIVNGSTSDTIVWGTAVAAGQTRTVDVFARTVVDGSSVDKYTELAATTTWFDLPAGTSGLTFTGCSSVTVVHRSAWF